MITGTTQLLGVIGDPIAHSLSPMMHNAAIAHLGLDYVYLPFKVQEANLAAAIAGFAAIGLRGFNITIPHKQAIMPFLTEITPLAMAVGAVNTVWRTEQGWSGTNTDVAGFLAPLTELQPTGWHERTVVVLGYGGAARSVVAGCSQLGCKAIRVIGRDADKLQVFQASWYNSSLASALAGVLSVHTWETLPDFLPQADLLVNTTPVGMYPYEQNSPLTDREAALLSAHAIAYDLIYIPNPTRFLQQAKDRGAIAIDGLEMLLQQGAAALEIWTQQPPPVEIMRQALRHKLGL